MRKTLVTGLEPFGGADVNPSANLVAALNASKRDGMIARVLPTAFTPARRQIMTLIDTLEPALILMFGVHGTAVRPQLERVALNFDHAEIADNAGEIRQSSPIDDAAPIAMEPAFDVIALHTYLMKRGHGVGISHHAGTYVCNHVYFSALTHLGRKGAATPALFIHIPAPGPDPHAETDWLAVLVDDTVAYFDKT